MRVKKLETGKGRGREESSNGLCGGSFELAGMIAKNFRDAER